MSSFVLLQDGGLVLLQDGTSALILQDGDTGTPVVVRAPYLLRDLDKQARFYSPDDGTTWLPLLSPAGPAATPLVGNGTSVSLAVPADKSLRLRSLHVAAAAANAGVAIVTAVIGSTTQFVLQLAPGESYAWTGCREGALGDDLVITASAGNIYVNGDVDLF